MEEKEAMYLIHHLLLRFVFVWFIHGSRFVLHSPIMSAKTVYHMIQNWTIMIPTYETLNL